MVSPHARTWSCRGSPLQGTTDTTALGYGYWLTGIADRVWARAAGPCLPRAAMAGEKMAQDNRGRVESICRAGGNTKNQARADCATIDATWTEAAGWRRAEVQKLKEEVSRQSA